VTAVTTMTAVHDDIVTALTETSRYFGTHAKWVKHLLDLFEK
jgi:hypothetical protein